MAIFATSETNWSTIFLTVRRGILKMAKTSKTIWYKRAHLQGQTQTLQELINAGVGKVPLASGRLMTVNQSEQIGLNLFQSAPEMFFAQFLSFTPGNTQHLITLADGSTAYNVETMAAQSAADGTKREFLESIAYFGVVDNHILLVQTKALTSRELEEYVIWFLTQVTNLVAKGAMITLDDPTANTARKKAARDNIRGVSFGTPVTAVATSETVRGQAVAKYELSEGVSAALQGLLGPSIFDNLKLKDSLEDDNIEVQVTVRVKRKRTVSEDGQKFLKALGRATRHMHPDDFELELNRAGSLKGKDLKLHHSVSVEVSDNGLADETSLMSHMKTWLAEITKMELIET